MAKKESTLWQLVITLTLISCIAGISLATVYSVTKSPIDKAQSQKKNDAMQQVLPNFKGKITEYKCEMEAGKDSVIVNMAYQGSTLFGAAVQTYTDIAFSGRFDIMVGFDAEGNILGTEVLKANETPGLGDKINKKKSDFAAQFMGKNPANYTLKVKKDGGEVDAITAATISSRAFCDAVDRAYKAYNKIKEEHHE
ncbi:MAG: RnfABCDGE type electron transport complex subunit G [Bacteroidales bacterium]